MNNNSDEKEDSDSIYDSNESYETEFPENTHSNQCTEDGFDVSSVKSAVSGDVIERIEDRRFSLPINISSSNNSLRQRTACSENDVTLKKAINESLHSIKSQLEDKLQKKLCKECLFRSIQSKLSMLGIVSASNRNIDVLESEPEENSDDELTLLKEKSAKGPSDTAGSKLMQGLHRRTVSQNKFIFGIITSDFSQNQTYSMKTS